VTGIALVVARICLAIVFAVAAVAKLADGARTRQAVADFGVPARLAPAVSVLLPVAELAVAVLLLIPSTARWGALGAVALLVAFTAVVAANLARGNAVDCNCFGQLQSRPISGATLARNAALLGVAVLLLAVGWDDAGPGPVGWVSSLGTAWAIVLVLGLVVAGLAVGGAWFALTLLRQNGRLLLRIERLEAAVADAGIELESASPALPGPSVGDVAPRFTLETAGGGTHTMSRLLAPGLPVLLVFADPGCGPCDELAPDVARWQRDHADAVTVAVVSGGDREASVSKADTHGLDGVLLDPDRSVGSAYQASGTPAAVLVSPAGMIAAPVAQGADAVAELFDRALVWVEPAAPGLPVGVPAPELELEELGGGTVALRDGLAADRETLVVFWNPGCGFCRAIHDDLRAWEQDAGANDSALLVMSAGEPEAVRGEGFGARVLLDPDFEGARAFGADGTPMAVLVGPDATIRSGLGGGAPAVLALAGAGVARVR
jgi:thiol-disulfide isomerase/thioredoxin/uncharacterized membrane protein YphA (DoxX/SURF4 family)